MISLLPEEWNNDPRFKKYYSMNCTDFKREDCNCNDDADHLVELWNQDWCTRGRIDTIVCTKCDTIKSFSIIR